jgi:hypothetical protein
VAWAVKITDEYAAWFRVLMKEDLDSATLVAQAVAALREDGPALGRPLVDRLKGSTIHHLSCARVRAAVLRWFRDNIPVAERLYFEYTDQN